MPPCRQVLRLKCPANRCKPLLCCSPDVAPPCPQVSRLQDPVTFETSYVVAEVDFTDLMESRGTIKRLQDDMEALLREILPQQVGPAWL